MTDDRLVDALHQRAERGRHRTARQVWADASESPYTAAPPSAPHRPAPTLAIVTVAAVAVALSAVAMLSPTDPHDPSGVGDGWAAWASDPPAGTTVVIAFLDLDDPVALHDRRDELMRMVGVLDAHPVSRAEAYDEFTELFGDDPAMIDAVTAAELPESVQLLVEAGRVDELEDEIGSRPGVWRVVRTVDRGAADLSVDHGNDTIVPGVPGSFPPAMTVPPDCMVALVYLTSLVDIVPAVTPPDWDHATICERATAGLVR